jgi:O-methyltransferase / aklanonic acid methyltransferase
MRGSSNGHAATGSTTAAGTANGGAVPGGIAGMALAAIAAFDEAAPRYDSSGAQFAGPIADRLVALAGLGPGDRVLDVGCGAGAVTLRSARAVMPDGRVTGIDLSDAMLRRVMAEAAGRGLGNVRAERGDASRPLLAEDDFDSVLASLVLYLLPDARMALSNWLELLRPGGTVAFSWGIGPDPRWSPVFRAVDAYAKGADGFEAYVRRLGPPEAMTGLLAECGYTGISITTETVPVRYTGPRQWWDASWAEAPRLAWQHIPDTDRPSARRDAFALLAGMREADGSLVREVEMGYAVARRPAPGPAPGRPDAGSGGPGLGGAAR